MSAAGREAYFRSLLELARDGNANLTTHTQIHKINADEVHRRVYELKKTKCQGGKITGGRSCVSWYACFSMYRTL